MCDVLELSELSTRIGARRRNGNGPSVYVRHPECLDTLRTLAQYLREDDFHFREVFLALSGMKILTEKLVPLLKGYPDDEETAYQAVTIATFLTMPVDPKTNDIQRQSEYVFQAKKGILAAHYLPQFACLFIDHLQSLPHVSLNRMEIILKFLKNMILIPSYESVLQTEQANIHEQVMEQVKESDLLNVLVVLCQHVQHPLMTPLAPLLLEIVHSILNQFQVENVIQSTDPSTTEQQEKSKMALKHSNQQAQRQLSRRQLTGGFVVKHCEENSGTQLIRMRQYTSRDTLIKKKRTHTKMTTSNSCLIVKEFMIDFLTNGYNPLMHAIQQVFATVDRSTTISYMTVCSFCLKYVSLLIEFSKRVENEEYFDCISVTGGWESYKRTLDIYVAQFMQKDIRLQESALSMLKELLFLFSTAYVSDSSENKQSANRLQRRILHDDRKESGLLSVLSKGIKGFSSKKHSRMYGQNLAEAIHVTLRMYESLNALENGNLQVKIRKRRSKKLTEDSPEDQEERTSERSYDMRKRVKQELANPKVITFYIAVLLKDYWKNTDFLNHVIISFLQKICKKEQMNLAPMLYQLSFLRIIQKIMEDPVVSSSTRFNELHSFCVTFCRNLFARITPSKEIDTVNESIMDQQEQEQSFSHACAKMLFLEMLVPTDMAAAINIRGQYGSKYFHEQEGSIDVLSKRQHFHCLKDLDNETADESEVDVVSCTEEQMNRLTVDDSQYCNVQLQKRPKTGHDGM